MVRLSNFGYLEINHLAMIEQLALIQLVYNSDVEGAKRAIGPENKLLAFRVRRNTYPPSWFLIKTDDERWFIVVEGSTNSTQFVFHATGTYFRDDYPPGGKVNGEFYGSWLKIWEEIKEDLGYQPTGRIHLSGHSYGGAIANIGGYWLLKEDPNCDVEIMTFGAPRALTTGVNTRKPDCNWRVESADDAVPTVPPSTLNLFTLLSRDPVEWLDLQYIWNHYGTPRVMQWDGSIGPTAPSQPEILGNLVEGQFPGVHLLSNYIGRVSLWWKNQGITPQAKYWIEIAQDAVYKISPKEEIFQLPQFIYRQDGFPILIPQGSQVKTGDFQMPEWKCVYRFTGKGGSVWDETHELGVGNTVDEAIASATATALLNARLAMLSPAYTLKGLRVSQVGLQRKGRPIYIGLSGTASTTSTRADIAGVAVSVKWFDDNSNFKFSWIRGITDDAVDVNAETGEVKFSAAFANALSNYTARLRAGSFGWRKRVPVTPGIPITNYNPILSVNGSTNPGYAVVTCLNPVLVASGSTVEFSTASPKTLPGFKGNFTVLQAAGNTLTVQYQVANDATIVDACGRLRVVQYQPFSRYFSSAAYDAIGRRTKNAFSQSRASQSARGVRKSR